MAGDCCLLWALGPAFLTAAASAAPGWVAPRMGWLSAPRWGQVLGPCVGVGAGGGGSGSLGLRLIVRPGASAVPFPAHAQATTDVAQE